MLDALVRGVRAAGLEVSTQELQDILWLAQRLPAGESAPNIRHEPPPDPGEGAPSNLKQAGKTPEPHDDEMSRIDSGAPSRAGSGTASTAVHARTLAGTISASTLRVPGVAATDFPDDLRRALQPFARRVPSRWRTALDEEATAEYKADVGLWCPIYKPVHERWFDLRLVVEDSQSMALWSETLAEFVRLLRNQGGFKSVTVYRWSDGKGEEVSTLDGRRRLPVSRLVERDRPLLVLLATDATSTRWRSGAARALLCSVGCHAAVSVLHMLPQRAWRYTAVGEPELKVYGERAGEANADMKALLPWWLEETEFREGLGVPVVGLDAVTLKPWARTMTAQGGASVPAVLMPRGGVEAGVRQDGVRAVSAVEKVARYRGMVSREAYDLAVFLSVPDPLTVPVMRLVQRTMLPSTGMAELAEFFVGGLLERVQVDGEAGEAAYRLATGVREELMKSLRYSEEGRINEQLRSVGRFLENAAEGGKGFDAYFPTPGGAQRMTEWSLPFASLSREVLRGDVAETVLPEAEREDEERRLVFVSYVRSDQKIVESFRDTLSGRLRAHPELGLGRDDVFVGDAEQTRPVTWEQEVRNAMERAAVLVFMVSERSLNAPVCVNELAEAHRMGIPIVPVLLDDTQWMKRRIPGAKQNRFLGDFAALPRSQNGRLRPLHQWKDLQEGVRAIVDGLVEVLPEMLVRGRAAEHAESEAAREELPRQLRALADACMAVPNIGFPSGLQTAIWFGYGVALTWAPRRSSLAALWKDPDHVNLPYEILDVWTAFLDVERDMGNMHPVADERLMHVATLQTGGPNEAYQLLALVDDGSAEPPRGDRKIMPIRAAGTVPPSGAECDLLYFIGPELVRDTAILLAGSSPETFHIEPGKGTRTWPLPPEATGAAVIADGACCGVVFDVGNAQGGVRAKSASVIRDAMRAQWVVRLHHGIERHREWVRSEASAGMRLRLDGADFTSVKMGFADLSGASLQAARFTEARLEATEFDGAKLQRARFDRAMLKSTTFVGADLAGAVFDGADLIDVNFGGAALRGASFDGARIEGCIWENAQLDEGALGMLTSAQGATLEADSPPPVRERITVVSARNLLSKNVPPIDVTGWQFLAAGGSWFNGQESLLHQLSLSRPAVAWWCDHQPGRLVRVGQLADDPTLHALLRSGRQDGLLLSIGGDDLFEAVCTPRLDTAHAVVPPSRRLLLGPDEWDAQRHDESRYISEEGMATLERYLHANLARIIHARDAGPSRGAPIFLQGFPAPMPRPAGLPGGEGPWLQPSFASYAIPIEHHWHTAQALISGLSRMLAEIAGDTSRYPNIFFFDPSQVTLAHASANFTGASGDWLTEVHPAVSGYQKIAEAWSRQIESVLEGFAGVTKA